MPYRSDPMQAGRHPFELFTLLLALLTGLPTVLGAIPRPGTIEDALPNLVPLVWSWVLFLGALCALVGIYWWDRATGLILEQLGLAFVGLASIVYAGCLVWETTDAVDLRQDALIAAAIVFGFGASCVRRYFQIQQTLDATYEVQERRKKGELK